MSGVVLYMYNTNSMYNIRRCCVEVVVSILYI